MGEPAVGVAKDLWSETTLQKAIALIGQYGDDAEIIAILTAAERAACNDLAGLHELDAVIACISALSAGPAETPAC
jgi:hypothetical protein